MQNILQWNASVPHTEAPTETFYFWVVHLVQLNPIQGPHWGAVCCGLSRVPFFLLTGQPLVQCGHPMPKVSTLQHVAKGWTIHVLLPVYEVVMNLHGCIYSFYPNLFKLSLPLCILAINQACDLTFAVLFDWEQWDQESPPHTFGILGLHKHPLLC